MSREIEQMFADEDGWSEWIHPLPGYLMQCCGCDLIHEMQVAITELHDAVSVTNEGEDTGHIVVFRMRNASAGEAGTAETTQIGSVHEHAVPNGETPTRSRQSNKPGREM